MYPKEKLQIKFYGRANFDMDEFIISPLKNIRKIRQVPAHELTNNKYDLDVYDKQRELMEDTYEALRAKIKQKNARFLPCFLTDFGRCQRVKIEQ